MERPHAIVLFERCYLGGLVVGLVNTAMSWSATMARMAEQPAAAQLGPAFGQSMLIGVTALSIGISLLLWYFTARQASVVTKWIITGFFVIGALTFLAAVVKGTMPHGAGGILAVIAWVLNAIAVWQLFKPESKRWFGEDTA
ncbi:hypothetical protein [Sphingomonas sp. PAMC 26605]|uniref:hypothetical protein n=1 Tax=Sphingomonas sp. PAMC 26605 TaxID=1112214 RepID=UPI00026CB57F|nr:hypothetical protein [Sphingomonas sp. PAMC 26605]